MKRSLLFLLFLSFMFTLRAQPVPPSRKYPSVLWEISGKGMKQPSYLMGTMHVSNKLAFHLSDSFYRAVRNVRMVALETNPVTWQDDMDKYEVRNFTQADEDGSLGNFRSMPAEYLSIKTLKFYNYNRKIESSLSSNPQTINSLLYRSNGNESEDFEEDTYLDMYIYQCGMRLGKRVTGLENYGESMRLMEEAARDAANEKNRKERSYGDRDERYGFDKLQDAYRSGNLDLLDSINRYNSQSEAYDEKFLYRRNEIQANSIDSILKSGTSLFAGVGAAHLPGNRGVIELLRKKGYKLRPVRMGERDSREKEVLEQLRVPVKFQTVWATDSLYRVDVPGNMHKVGDDGALEQQQYSDMANGSFYLVTRIMTNAWMWGHTDQEVYHNLDSLLYENVPGKIISRKEIVKNGYRGLDIINRTRRGDQQHYQIFLTPFELIFFKTGGNGNYISQGTETGQFFNSIVLRPYQPSNTVANWQRFSPPGGGFSIDMPHAPYTGNDGSWIWDAADPASGTHFRVIRSDIHHFGFAEEDTFDLSLMEESFRASEFIDTQLTHQHGNWKGYPSLESSFRDKRGKIYRTRFIVQGPHYYTLVAQAAADNRSIDRFFNSFSITPYRYPNATPRADTSMAYTVKSPVFNDRKKIPVNLYGNYRYGSFGNDEADEKTDPVADGIYRNRIVANDTTGEKIFISLTRFPEYGFYEDSTLAAVIEDPLQPDSNWIRRDQQQYELPGGIRVTEVKLTDKNSSRCIWRKTFYRHGALHALFTETDTLTAPGDFVRNFYETFRPADTLQGSDPFAPKWKRFHDDFMSLDSVRHKRALRKISDMYPDSADFADLRSMIRSLDWKEKKYLAAKEGLIMLLARLPQPAVTDHLVQLYRAAGDTIRLQYITLESMLQQETPYAYQAFGRIMRTDPPVYDEDLDNDADISYGGTFLDQLSDSLDLTKTILPDLLPLINLDDYKSGIMELLATLVDSNRIAAPELSAYADRFVLEARQELKKQAVLEKKKEIEKAEKRKSKKEGDDDNEDESSDEGNDDLYLYARLLRPFYDTKPAVKDLLGQMLGSGDKQLRYQVLTLMLRNDMKYPDSVLKQFMDMDEYRYTVFRDLRDMHKLALFPERLMTPGEMGLSALYDEEGYSDKPDSIIFLDSLRASVKGKEGWVWFYKYKSKKDDLNWRIATTGLFSPDPHEFIYEDQKSLNEVVYRYYDHDRNELPGFNMNELTGTLLKTDEPVRAQLEKMLKKMQYSRHRSAKEFYDEDENGRPGRIFF